MKRQNKKVLVIVLALVVAVVGICVVYSTKDRHGFSLKEIERTGAGWLQRLVDVLVDGTSPAAVVPTLEDSNLQVHVIDVGQGESILIQAPEANVLIDSGERGQEETVLSFLRQQQVERLDIVLITHPHSDHMGAMSTIIERMDVGRIVMSDLPDAMIPTTRVFTDLLESIAAKNLSITPAVPGDVYDLGEDITLTVLSPVSQRYDNLNDFSVVTRLEDENISFLFTGDLELRGEKDLLDAYRLRPVTILNVGHHGSSTSTGEDFLTAIRPQIALISCSMDNSYGHPHREVLERLKDGNIHVHRTDMDGTISVETNGTDIAIVTEK